MANFPCVCTSHTPAMSQLPLCGNAKTSPRPSAMPASMMSAPRNVLFSWAASARWFIVGSRNASRQ
ncbi:Uncharacterised protein [Mycobacterium tuberculosis]|nr:Uncharacterised protein [Mycobacterium tuberculosis]